MASNNPASYPRSSTLFSPSSTYRPGQAYRHPSPPNQLPPDDTINQLNRLVDMDVDSAQPEEIRVFLIIDTNVLLNDISLVQSLAQQIIGRRLPVVIIVPGIVIQELDSLKNGSDQKAWSSRYASRWLLAKVVERQKGGSSAIRGQSLSETLQESRSWRFRNKGSSNDDLIVDCALYFRRRYGNDGVQRGFFVWSGDTQLCTQAVVEGLLVVHNQASSRQSPDDILEAVGYSRPLSSRHSKSSVARSSMTEDESMDVDDEMPDTSSQDNGPPSLSLNELHSQIIDHFSILLHELASSRAKASAASRARRKGGLHSSIHAPRPLVPLIDETDDPAEWKMHECIHFLCLETLDGKRNTCLGNSTVPRLANFLTPAYTPGGKRGEEWSRQDWIDSLSFLWRIADYWGDPAILNGLQSLKSILELQNPHEIQNPTI
ncbi:hypothetical protein SISSUDRAFT_1126735 [Sistotremastrum suecicum HHB10207 ss-3]|uniref:PIN domain-containing protein n=1 Tax=Sistotremastrum suecicum HHB10207 ss-3 TaxID=1314776 RepID=A0A166G040_9AGAM|nr:hypothetical protein SISSUDRAFT_1126735 [Sistotremastrum suecicum HHB10207 ss-3]